MYYVTSGVRTEIWRSSLEKLIICDLRRILNKTEKVIISYIITFYERLPSPSTGQPIGIIGILAYKLWAVIHSLQVLVCEKLHCSDYKICLIGYVWFRIYKIALTDLRIIKITTLNHNVLWSIFVSLTANQGLYLNCIRINIKTKQIDQSSNSQVTFVSI